MGQTGGLQLFVGRPPFEGETVIELLMQHTNSVPPAPRSLAPDLPQPLDALLLSLLAKDPGNRVQTCAELATRLTDLELAA